MMAPGETTPIPLTIRAPSATLFGILYAPERPTGVAAVLLGNENVGLGRSRMLVRLARELASHGVATLRFDARGTGESSGGANQLNAVRPFADDLLAATELLRRDGYERIVLVGTCGGGRTMLAAADRVDGLEAAVLLSVVSRARRTWAAHRLTNRKLLRIGLHPATWPALLRREKRRRAADVLRAVALARRARARDRRAGASQRGAGPPLDPPFVDGLRAMADRAIPVLLLYGDEDSVFTEMRDAQDPQLSELLAPGASSIELRVLPGALHTRQHRDVVDAAIDATAEFVTRAVSAIPSRRR